MKSRPLSIVSITTLALVFVSAMAFAAPSPDGSASADMAKMEACFKAHGKLMAKPSVMNVYDCWRAHAYLMDR